jgi:succinate dehydrogenase / fumarate reductase flavoprotein subunit
VSVGAAHHHTYDVVVVGAGGAGLRAALESSTRVRTAVLTKLHPTRSHTGAAQGGMSAALANVEEDTCEWHAFDTIDAGDYLVDQDAAEVMCREAIDAVLDLERMGLPFSRTPDGRIDQRRLGGHTRNHGEAATRRSCYAAGRTGHLILQTLYQNCVQRNVEFYNEFHVLDLVIVDDRVCGVVAYEWATGDVHVFTAKAVVLATGGFGRVFKTTSNAHTLTGDAMAIAWRRGVPLEDMEFFQFHPTGLAGLGILISETARAEGGVLRNATGERFMERYAPNSKELAPADVVSRSIASEVREGRGAGPQRDYVLLDLAHLPPEHIDAKLSDVADFARTYLGVEPYDEPVPVSPTAHYAMGGVPTTIRAEVLRDNTSVVPGLYAAGEAACVSVHGANRLSANSLLDVNVFGRRAGVAAAEYAATSPLTDAPATPEASVVALVQGLLTSHGSERTAAIRRALQDTMDRNAQVCRSEESLKQAEADIAALKVRYLDIAITDKSQRFNSDLLEAVELGFLLDLADVLVVSARARTESRGAHFRDDHPHRDDANFLRHTMAYHRPDGTIRLDHKPVTQTRYQPTERRYP